MPRRKNLMTQDNVTEWTKSRVDFPPVVSNLYSIFRAVSLSKQSRIASESNKRYLNSNDWELDLLQWSILQFPLGITTWWQECRPSSIDQSITKLSRCWAASRLRFSIIALLGNPTAEPGDKWCRRLMFLEVTRARSPITYLVKRENPTTSFHLHLPPSRYQKIIFSRPVA